MKLPCGCVVDERDRYKGFCQEHAAEYENTRRRWLADKLAQELGYISHADRLEKEQRDGKSNA
jgi:hypothetical protein